jgi:nucleotidyltransferase substrate binding protein (TIGR01987 family)
MAQVSKDEFSKALIALEEAFEECSRSEPGTKIYKLMRDAAIQRFEFCVELAWKVSVKSLGVVATSPKPALREMFKAGLISDFNTWFDYIEARNKSSHTYDENIAAEVYSHVEHFIDDARSLLSKI